MTSGPNDRYAWKGVGLWLRLSAHCDAFRANPRAYLMANWWRLRGKRLRSRSQFAGLLGGSPRAYDLWMLWHEEVASHSEGGAGGPPILALVDAKDAGQGTVEETMLSLSADGMAALLIGTADSPTLADAARRIDWSASPWLMPMTAGDQIAPGAADAYRAAIAALGRGDAPARIVFADDDCLDRRNRRTGPHFKPDWNSELFAHHDYLTGACIVRAAQADLDGVAGSADWAHQLVMQIAGAGEGAPVHVRQILHHRHSRIAPKIPATPAIASADLPPVTVIVPTRNRVDLLRTCLNGVEATDYPALDVIVVDNDSDDAETLSYLDRLDPARYQVLRHSGPFNYSAINNRAAAMAQGRLLCLLNNDIEMIAPDWLAIMAWQAMRADVGAVGARLLYPDGRIQHAGVVIGVGNAAGHAHRLLHPDEEGYFRRHALPQFTSAVTAACLLMQRSRFEAVGGLNERDFAVAFNDVDLCLRLNQRGWQSFYEPRATLIHHESVSRGLDQDPVGAARFAGELAALQRIWKTDEIFDPYHHLHLSRVSEKFALALG